MKFRTICGTVGSWLNGMEEEIRILMYHRVTPEKNLPDMQITVPVQNFIDQMQWLKLDGWKVISLSDAIEQLQQKQLVESKQIVITFDDGFLDNFTQAYPILRAFDYRATIFLVSSRIGKDPDFLTPWQIQAMHKNGIEFGAHTLTHPDLHRISGNQAWKEIYQSRSELEKMLKIPIRTFAYPSGRFNQIHQAIVRYAGYDAALTVAPGGVRPGDDLFSLQRTEIASKDSLSDFKNKLKGGFDWLHRIRQRQQGLLPIPQPAQRSVS